MARGRTHVRDDRFVLMSWWKGGLFVEVLLVSLHHLLLFRVFGYLYLSDGRQRRLPPFVGKEHSSDVIVGVLNDHLMGDVYGYMGSDFLSRR